MGTGATVGIVIADLAAWVLIMVVVGKWRDIIKWFRTTLFHKTSAKADA